jgi:hypothetical protein
VELRQAGSQVVCACGSTLDVPTLRGLQALPRADDGAEASVAVWTFRQAVVTAGVLISLVLFGVGVWNWRHERTLRAERDSREFTAERLTAMDKSVVESLERMTPHQMWHAWEYLFKPTVQLGFVDINAPAKAAFDEAIRWKRRERFIWWGVATVVLAGVLLWAAVAPNRKAVA